MRRLIPRPVEGFAWLETHFENPPSGVKADDFQLAWARKTR
jgi:hypothetical protein